MPACFWGERGAVVNHGSSHRGKMEPRGQLEPEGAHGARCPVNATIFWSGLEEDLLLEWTLMAFIVVASL